MADTYAHLLSMPEGMLAEVLHAFLILGRLIEYSKFQASGNVRLASHDGLELVMGSANLSKATLPVHEAIAVLVIVVHHGRDSSRQ